MVVVLDNFLRYLETRGRWLYGKAMPFPSRSGDSRIYHDLDRLHRTL